ncbi:MAG: histidine kinase, partial [Saprospiraceae bacterium]|nr:histidine kinase [Saprospiraceae bacterium]
FFTIFFSSLVIISLIYFIANVGIAWKKQNLLWMIVKFVLIFPIFMALSMGLSFHNSIAVLQGFIGKKTDFVRTPKYGIRKITDSFRKDAYFNSKLSKQTMFEGVLALYFITAFAVGIIYNLNYFQLLHGLLAFGYSLTFFISVKHAK